MRVVRCLMDFAGPKAIRRVADYIWQHNATRSALSMRLLRISLVVRIIGVTLLFTEAAGQTQAPALRTADPYAAEGFSCAGKTDGRLFNSAFEASGYGRFRIVADLNFDGLEDVILTRSEKNGGTGCGNSSCDVAIYLGQSDGMFTSFLFGLHPLATALKRIKPGEGLLVIYGRVSAGEGVLSSFSLAANSVTRLADDNLRVNELPADKELYLSWFSGDSALKPDYAACRMAQLLWRPGYE